MLDGVLDIVYNEDAIEIYTEPTLFNGVRDALSKCGYEFASAEVEFIPTTYTALTDDDAVIKMQRLLDALDDNDDVQNVYHN